MSCIEAYYNHSKVQKGILPGTKGNQVIKSQIIANTVGSKIFPKKRGRL